MVTPLNIPFPNSFWVLPKKFLAGPYPGNQEKLAAAQRIDALLGCGITHVINLMEPDEVNSQGLPFAPYIETMQALAAERGRGPVDWSRYPIRDGGIPEKAAMGCILDEIDRALAASQPVYLHCWGGKGRTGTVIGCFLARHSIACGQQALDRILYLRKNIQPFQPSPETGQQLDFVLTWRPGE